VELRRAVLVNRLLCSGPWSFVAHGLGVEEIEG
jgi:hypothetical protein